MKTDTLRVLAIFMSCLIITIPFYVSNVHAALQEGITVSEISGKDGVNEVRAMADDLIEISVNVVAAKKINETDLHVVHPALPRDAVGRPIPAAFTSCTKVGAMGFEYNCIYRSSAGTMPMGSYTGAVHVCLTGTGRCSDDCSSCICSTCGNSPAFYSDGDPPIIHTFDINPKNTNGKNLAATYTVEDRVCPPSACKNMCAGIQKIEIVDSGTVLATEELNTPAHDCTRSGTINFNMTSSDNGIRQVCIKAYDTVGNANEESNHCIEINKDDSGPSITSADVYDSSGTSPLKFVKPEGTGGKFIANVETSPLFSISSATADLSALGGSTVSLSCSGASGVFTCSAPVTLTTAVSGSITVTVMDSGGNEISETIPVTIDTDATFPVVENVITDHNYLGQGWLGPGDNNVAAVIAEDGSGMGGSLVSLSIGGSAQPSTCTEDGGKWYCIVSNVSASADTEVTVSGTDDAGNALAPYTKTLNYDSENPVLVNVTLFNLAYGEHPDAPFIFLTGDDMEVRAFITDNSAIMDDYGVFNVVGNFSGFATPSFVSADSCDNVTGGWLCIWNLIDLVDGNVTARFSINDIVGNADNSTLANPMTEFYVAYKDPATNQEIILPYPTEVEVYEQETNESPDYWESSVIGVYPSAVDSATLRVLQHDVWFSLALAPRPEAGTVELISATFDPADCWGEDFESYADYTNSFIVRSMPNSTEPWIKMALYAQPIDKNKLRFNCSLRLISFHNNKISMPETENITLNVDVIKVGEISDSIDDEIDKVKNSGLVQMTWLDTFVMIVNTLDQLCNILGLIRSLSVVLSDLDVLLVDIGDALKATVVLKDLGEALRKLGGGLGWMGGLLEWKGTVMSEIYKFCDWVACRHTQVCGKKSGGSNTASGLKESAAGAQSGAKSKWFCILYDVTLGKVADSDAISGALKLTQGTLDKLGGAGGFISEMNPGLQPTAGGAAPGPNAMMNLLWGDPRSSLILSILHMCLPGIILKLQQAREIECAYLLCLKQQIPAGVPAKACTIQRSYQWCLFIWGEIFSIIPFASLIKSLLSQLSSILTNPASFIGVGVFMLCKYGTEEVKAGCRVVNSISQLMDIIEAFKALFNAEDLFNFETTGICSQALEEDD